MDVNLARTFLAVVETGSFVDAANRVHVTQSTVSSRIRSLEDLIGKTLFERSKAGASLTVAGDQFRKHAIALVRVWEHARLEVGLDEEYQDHIAVGGQFSLWDGFILSWVAQLRTQIPDIAITASLGFSSGLMERLIEGTIDLGVMYRPVQRPGLKIEHLFDEELVMITSGDARLRQPSDSYIFVNWGPEFQADHALAFPDETRPGLFLDIGTLGVNYLLGRTATGYFPIRAARPYLESGELRVVKRAPRFVYPAYAVYSEEKDDAVFEPMLEILRDLAGSL